MKGRWIAQVLLFGTVLILVIGYFVVPHELFIRKKITNDRIRTGFKQPKLLREDELPNIPSTLYSDNIYSKQDFRNKDGIVPSYWKERETVLGKKVWGPCYPPSSDDVIDWNRTIDLYNQSKKFHYTKPTRPASPVNPERENLSNFCRPGFLIIGQGKCGTSSLYHYLTGHPRVAPASEKQIHYFKYYTKFPMKWYLAHFPDAQSYLASGALTTGEASPGYLPYPSVVQITKQRMPGPKIICVGRDPLDRSWSSYRYNYVNPAIAKFRAGKLKHFPSNLTDAEYMEKYLFSFEEMLKAELTVLKKCLAPDGVGVTGAKKTYGSGAFKHEYERREREGLPPMIDLDGQCYGGYHSKAAPRRQWIELAKAQPDKFLNVPNLHLSQAIIGRSLYVFPLEWWYALFPRDDLYFLCTEEMRDMTGDPLNKLGLFLGLPSFNFSGVVAEGMYNVGGHKGYDKVTPWEEMAEEQAGVGAEGQDESEKDEIPISEEFRKELMNFFKPYNERLFELVGRRCDW